MNNLTFDTLTIHHNEMDFKISYFLRQGSGDTIIYLHGLGSTYYDFIEAAKQERLEKHTLFAFDFPGSPGF